MSTTNTFTVAGMTCGHCVQSVEEAIGEIDGVESVTVDLDSGLVTVRSDTAISTDAVASAVDGAGYRIAS
ncbi:MAG: copper ion binding protein [Acidimicrobiales bacterium]|nr:copper ion binding protein [Acidimicrobiales bacterium]